MIIMELLRGEDMHGLRTRTAAVAHTLRYPHASKESRPRFLPIAAADAAHCAKEMIDAVKGMHELGMLHRDVKPSNFMR